MLSPSPRRSATRRPFTPLARGSSCLRPGRATFKLFSSRATGLGVELPGWRYPVVCDTASGQLRVRQLRRSLGREGLGSTVFCRPTRSRRPSSRPVAKGHTVTEQPLADGSIKLTVQLGGAS